MRKSKSVACRSQCRRDFYGPYGDGDAVDPSGPARSDISSSRVLRGGSWNNIPRLCRAAYRHGDSPDYRLYNGGFRVCLDFHPRKAVERPGIVALKGAAGEALKVQPFAPASPAKSPAAEFTW
jgi:hypothetical protein